MRLDRYLSIAVKSLVRHGHGTENCVFSRPESGNCTEEPGMPLFEFRCSACARDFELLIRSGDRAKCPECGTESVEKLLSEAAAPVAAGSRSLPVASACPPGGAPCS